MTGAISGARTVYSSGAAEFIPIFSWFMLLNFLFFVDHYFWPFFLFFAFLQITSSDYALVYPNIFALTPVYARTCTFKCNPFLQLDGFKYIYTEPQGGLFTETYNSDIHVLNNTRDTYTCILHISKKHLSLAGSY
jgi:hypothetical protein